VSRKRIKSAVQFVLEEQNIQTPLEVSIAIVGDRKDEGTQQKISR